MSIVIPHAAARDYELARAYLCRDSRERALISKIERCEERFRLRLDRRGNDRFDPDTRTIWWDPYSALRTTRGVGQTPALGLGHEIDHAVQAQPREQRLLRDAVPRYDNCEERRVIRGSERHAAHTLGEGIRFDHRGTLYRVATPVSR